MTLYGACALVLTAGLARGQTASKALSFDAASVKIAGLNSRMKGGPGTSDPGRIIYTQISLLPLMMKAWGVESYRIAGPAWLTARGAEWYNIAATIPPGTTKQQFQLMLQNLLVERFQIQLHHETRNYPGYELVVAPGGSKLGEPANPDAPEPSTGPPSGADKEGFPLLPPGHGKGVVMSSTGVYAKFQNCTLAELIDPYLQSFIRQATGTNINHIIDKTGLAGKYDYTLKFDSHAVDSGVLVAPGVRAGQIPSVDSPGDPSGLPDLFKAMEKQLGLKLVKSKGFLLDTIVIDHMEKTPIGN